MTTNEKTGTATRQMLIRVVRADLISLKVDAIVNPARIASTAGDEGHAALIAGDPPASLPVGSAVASTGGNVLCRFIIHAAVPNRSDADAEQKLEQATTSSLQRAEELALGSIAVPAMAVGPGGFTLQESARIVVRATVRFRDTARSLQRVLFCVFGEEAEEAFTRALEEAG